MKKIYLATPGVFRGDAVSYGVDLLDICRDAGFEGIYPLGDEQRPDEDPLQAAMKIYKRNCEKIKSADYLVADLNDFRGPGEPDSGTSWEVGFATGIGKPVWGYTSSDKTLIERVPTTYKSGLEVCEKGFMVEDFGLLANLMLSCSTMIIVGDLKECLAEIRAFETAYGVQE
jgi:nucleoside 2-deoxyribosyltransferase